MQNNQAWVWVTLVVAVIPQIGAFVTLWHSNRRWRSEREHQWERWREEVRQQNKRWDSERQHSVTMAWREKRLEVYSKFLDSVEGFEIKYRTHGKPGARGLQSAALLEAEYLVRESFSPLRIMASGATLRAANDVYGYIVLFASPQVGPEYQEEAESMKVNVEIVRRSKMLRELMRAEMGIETEPANSLDASKTVPQDSRDRFGDQG